MELREQYARLICLDRGTNPDSALTAGRIIEGEIVIEAGVFGWLGYLDMADALLAGPQDRLEYARRICTWWDESVDPDGPSTIKGEAYAVATDGYLGLADALLALPRLTQQ